MDFSQDSNKMGKNLGDDFKLGKTTLPIILVWERSNQKEKQIWDRTLRELNQNSSDLNTALEIFNKYNIFVECKKMAAEFIIKSKNSLEDFSNSEFKDYLIGLANESIDRSKWVLINE